MRRRWKYLAQIRERRTSVWKSKISSGMLFWFFSVDKLLQEDRAPPDGSYAPWRAATASCLELCYVGYWCSRDW